MSQYVLRVDTDHKMLDMMQTAVDRITGSSIQIQIARQSVLLSGHVESWHQKQYAQECIRHLSGERTISNGLSVTPRQSHSGAQF